MIRRKREKAVGEGVDRRSKKMISPLALRRGFEREGPRPTRNARSSYLDRGEGECTGPMKMGASSHRWKTQTTPDRARAQGKQQVFTHSPMEKLGRTSSRQMVSVKSCFVFEG